MGHSVSSAQLTVQRPEKYCLQISWLEYSIKEASKMYQRDFFQSISHL